MSLLTLIFCSYSMKIIIQILVLDDFSDYAIAAGFKAYLFNLPIYLPNRTLDKSKKAGEVQQLIKENDALNLKLRF